MRPFYFISLLFVLFAFAQEGFSQNQQPQTRTRQRATANTVQDNTPALTERAKIKNEEASKAPVHVAWLREIYRNIDLKKENNAALYYPTQPIADRINLFFLIFNLMSDGKIVAYNYLDGREVFTDAEKVNFENVLKKYQILYTTQGTGDNLKYVVDESDVPSSEVLSYLVKEGWYFDAATGSFNSQIIAICPIMVREDYYTGNTNKDALFWIPYENIRPYLSREMIMTSNYNNALTYTMDDYFTKKMYSGEIVKTVNLMNQTLAQQVGSEEPEALKLAQDSIETQLKFFEKQLWVQEDTTKLAVAEKNEKKEKTTNTRSVRNSTEKAKKEKEEKPKAAKAEKSSSPTRSVRRTR
jgi:gliding motility associated protien GldN